ncbi:hypothetical protein DITRI_Ditri17bG0007700 [Diplodiscus trichospermus]
MVRAASIIGKGIRALVRNGHNTNFWLDPWLKDMPLINFLLHEISLIDLYKKVEDYWLQDEDGMYWAASKSGLFTVSSAYEIVCEFKEPESNGIWKQIWSLQVDCKFDFAWNIVFAATILWLWRCQNTRVFNDEMKSLEFKISWIKFQVAEICKAFESKSELAIMRKEYINKQVTWVPSLQGWIKLNIDGCCKTSMNLAGGGGLLRDQHRHWLKGLSFDIGSCGAMEAEIWACMKALRLAWTKGYHKVQLELDSDLLV